MTGLIERASSFAAQAHDGQMRKYTGDPYIIHPQAVAALVRDAGGDDAMVAAAWLHDTVEDTPVTLDELRAVFGADVADLVYWLTDVSRPEDGSRAFRKSLDRDHITRAPAWAKAIKLADLIDNTNSITTHDPGFARIYMQEKAALLEVLADAVAECAAGAVLFPVAAGIVAEFFEISAVSSRVS